MAEDLEKCATANDERGSQFPKARLSFVSRFVMITCELWNIGVDDLTPLLFSVDL